jgi:hypothetical protein
MILGLARQLATRSTRHCAGDVDYQLIGSAGPSCRHLGRSLIGRPPESRISRSTAAFCFRSKIGGTVPTEGLTFFDPQAAHFRNPVSAPQFWQTFIGIVALYLTGQWQPAPGIPANGGSSQI